jgi:hypothetical protein
VPLLPRRPKKRGPFQDASVMAASRFFRVAFDACAHRVIATTCSN